MTMTDNAAAPEPDRETIERHFELQTARWHELGQPLWLELRAIAEGREPHWARFRPDALGEAAEWAASMNRLDRNTYAVQNPVRNTVVGAATDADIVGAVLAFADCDDAGAGERLRAFVGPKPRLGVVSGTTPHWRGHAYWELSEWITDMLRWSDLQRRIAAALGSDPRICNPSRIMRIAGTVSHPAAHKRAKGYVSEVATLRTKFRRPRGPISFEDMQRAFPPTPDAPAPERPQGTAGSVEMDTGIRPSVDTEAAKARALSGQEWHNNMIRAVARWVAKGLTDDEIVALTRDWTTAGYTTEDTEREVREAIRGAKGKGWAPAGGYEDSGSAGVAAPAASVREILARGVSRDVLLSVPPRRWVYGRKLIRGFCTLLASPGGLGKSSLLTAMALDMASGVKTLHDEPRSPLRVWLYNLEDPLDETFRKLAAGILAKSYPVDPLPNIYANSGREDRLILAEEPKPGLMIARPEVEAVIAQIKANRIDVLVVDPVVRSHLMDENSNKAVDFIMDLYARIAHEADCAVMLVHHTRKGFVSGDMDSVRGGSSMVSAARAVFTLSAMSEEEAKALNITSSERRFLVRLDNAKANLAPKADVAEWYRLEGQGLGNGTDEYPEGDTVQYVVPWTPPEAHDGLTVSVANEILDQIERGIVDEEGFASRYSIRSQDGDRWAGNVIIAAFRETAHEKSTAQATRILKEWEANGVIEVTDYRDEAQRKTRKGIAVKQRPGAAGDE